MKKYGAIPEIFEKEGETTFRDYESEIIAEVSKSHRLVIATGGGAVLRERNRLNLRQNGRIVYLKRDISALTDEGRPLSKGGRIETLYRERDPIYQALAEITVENKGNVEDAVNRIIQEVKV